MLVHLNTPTQTNNKIVIVISRGVYDVIIRLPLQVAAIFDDAIRLCLGTDVLIRRTVHFTGYLDFPVRRPSLPPSPSSIVGNNKLTSHFASGA